MSPMQAEDTKVISENGCFFGLGEAQTVDEVEVVWPSGRIDRIAAVKTNQLLKVIEGAEGR